MLTIKIPKQEGWNETTEEFVNTEDITLNLEHSLVSLSKWESKWKKSFLSNTDQTTEETIDYIKCMTITQNVNPNVYDYLTDENIKQINDYIADPMTATTFRDLDQGSNNREIWTAEIIYYYMIAFNIPVEFQKWHLNRLLTLIRVCSIKQSPSKKMKRNEILSRNAELNKKRKQQLKTKG